ncbi:unnamed protein product [Rotaria sp. Silwood1]|nr:unnamed protein product [Rotaria sp. Silwood1]
MSTILLFIFIIFSSVNLIYSTIYRCNPSISCGCSALNTTITSRIVGGEAASNYAWGWMVSLQQSNSHICGASLLTSEYAVTAAHCVEDVIHNISVLSILAGTNYLNYTSITTIQRRSIIDVIMHSDYNSTVWINDIAILKFSSLDISSNSKIAFICLPKQDEDPFQSGTNLVAIGWGDLFENSRFGSDSLQQVTVQAFSSTSDECQASEIVNPSVQFCAGVIAGDKDTCQGDSGGPLMAFVNNRWILAGLSSSGIGCAEAGFLGLYTRVSYFISFINSNVNFPVTETTTVSLGTTTSQRSNSQTSTLGNNGYVINKSINTYQCDPNISCGCSTLTTTVTSRIVGGEAASNYAWGWMVSLQRSDEHSCGASLLTSEYAVTTAHCVEDVMHNISILSILAGTNYLNYTSITTIQRRSIINVTMHPDFNSSTHENDIAILKFSPLDISSNSKIAFICLAKQDEDPFQSGTNLVAIGWGYKSEFIHVVSNSLQQVTVQAFSSTSDECQVSQIVNPSVQFCAGVIAGGKDACQGDSGGPLMAFVNNSWVLAGITSEGIGCAEAGFLGLYTRVSYFISFINSNVNFPMAETTTVSGVETTTVSGVETTTVSGVETTAVSGVETTMTEVTESTTPPLTESTMITTIETTMVSLSEATTSHLTESTTVELTEATTVPVTETTITVPLKTSISQHKNNQSAIQMNNGNMKNKSITVVIFCFSFLTYFFSY